MTLQDYITQANTRIVDSSNGTLSTANIVLFLNEALRRARRHMELPTQMYKTPVFLMSGIYEYALPAGYEDYAAITGPGIVPDTYDFYRVEREADFWRRFLNINSYSESRNGADRLALINLVNPSLAVATVNQATVYTGAGEGTWTAGADAANVRTNTLLFKTGAGSVCFDIDVSLSVNDYAEISNSTMTAVDLSGSNVEGVGKLTMFVYLPSVSTQYTSFTARWGSSASDYYELTVTTQQNGGAFVQGWNTLAFDWSTVTSAETTGTPDTSAINYVLLRATYPAGMTDQTGLCVNGIYMREQRLCDWHYYSGYLVIDGTTGDPKESFDDENDTESYFNCDDEFVDWLTYDLMENVFTMYDIDPNKAMFHRERRLKLEEDLKEKFASQREIPVTAYMETDQLQNFLN